jgi:DNA-directed RNA polymerase subunit RPC12/RpoP
MLIHKCDKCKKEIPSSSEAVNAGIGWERFSFCSKCGAPIVELLKKFRLMKSPTPKASIRKSPETPKKQIKKKMTK